MQEKPANVTQISTIIISYVLPINSGHTNTNVIGLALAAESVCVMFAKYSTNRKIEGVLCQNFKEIWGKRVKLYRINIIATR